MVEAKIDPEKKLLFLLMFLILVGSIYGTYAYFSSKSQGEEQTIVTGKIDLSFVDNNPILNDYIRGIIMAVENSNKKEILKDVETNLIAKFPFAHILNNEELMSYGLLVFYMLLKSNKEITEKDIVEQTEVEMKLYSARTIIEEADSLLDKLKK